jgi:hypothetical protein
MGATAATRRELSERSAADRGPPSLSLDAAAARNLRYGLAPIFSATSRRTRARRTAGRHSRDVRPVELELALLGSDEVGAPASLALALDALALGAAQHEASGRSRALDA